MITIYVLQLSNNKYYVGKTTNITNRILEHFTNNGSAWTRKYKPKSIVETIPNADKYDEDKYVKKYMEKYGIDNVRGGSYTCIELDDEQEELLNKEIMSANDICYRCGRSGHFSNNCYASKHIDGYYIDSDSSNSNSSDSEASSDSDDDTCYRCGREGHYSSDCYASTHVNGYKLK